VARAFGADGIYIAGVQDKPLKNSIGKMVDAWGGPFWLEFTASPLSLLKSWKKERGRVVHLTMYGLPIKDVLNDPTFKDANILVVVGGEKVPWEYYKESDLNVAIGNQPHSEVAALAIFLDRIEAGSWESKSFQDAHLNILPSKKGKTVKQFDQKKKAI